MKQTQKTAHQGFVILFVVLIASIILLIGAGVFTISLKQNILSSTARESQLAFSAADSAVECALYRDRLGEISLSSTSIQCADMNIPINQTYPDVYEFNLPMSGVYGIVADNLPCAHVEVSKNFSIGSSLTPGTQILARGYNVCTDSGEPALNNPLLLERMLEVTYSNAPITTGTLPSDSGVSPTNPAVQTGTGSGTGTGGTSTSGGSLSATATSVTNSGAQ